MRPKVLYIWQLGIVLYEEDHNCYIMGQVWPNYGRTIWEQLYGRTIEKYDL